MRFLSTVRADENSEAGKPPHPGLMAAMNEFVDELTREGVLVAVGGLLPSSKGARMRLAGGQITVVDGPFTEAKEVIGGYAIFDVQSKDEMIEIGRRFLQVHADILGPSYETVLEIREMPDTGLPAV